MSETMFMIISGAISLLGLGGNAFVVATDPAYIVAVIIPTIGFVALFIFTLASFIQHLRSREMQLLKNKIAKYEDKRLI
jgi:hypothetical protein